MTEIWIAGSGSNRGTEYTNLRNRATDYTDSGSKPFITQSEDELVADFGALWSLANFQAVFGIPTGSVRIRRIATVSRQAYDRIHAGAFNLPVHSR